MPSEPLHYAWFLADLALVFAALLGGGAIGTVVHEAGHALAGRLAGLQIRSVRIGLEPLACFRWGATRVELGLPSGIGWVVPYPPLEVRRGRQAVLLLGGVLGNLALLILLATAFAAFEPTGSWRTAVLILAGWQVLMIVENLVPFRMATEDGGMLSDGGQLLELLRGRGPEPTGRLYAAVLQPLGGRPGAGSAERAFATRVSFECEVFLPETQEDLLDSIARLEADLPRAPSPAEAALVLEALVRRSLFAMPSGLDDRLDGWNAALAAVERPTTAIHATRGAVLALLGRDGEALRLLARAAADPGLAVTEQAFVDAHVALALAHQGQPAQALGLIARARRLFPASATVWHFTRLFDRYEARILRGARPPSPVSVRPPVGAMDGAAEAALPAFLRPAPDRSA